MIIEKQETSPGYILGEIMKGGSGSGNFGHDGRPGQVGGSGEVYHATAEGYAQSIMKNGLKVSKSGKGMIGGVYGSIHKGESFYYGTHAAIKEFQQGVSSGKYKPSDSKNVKIMMVVADQSQFPESGYSGKENTIFRSKKDIPPSSFKRVEIYKIEDADKFARKYQDAIAGNKILPKMPPPKPISIIKKTTIPELFLSFGFIEDGQ